MPARRQAITANTSLTRAATPYDTVIGAFRPTSRRRRSVCLAHHPLTAIAAASATPARGDRTIDRADVSARVARLPPTSGRHLAVGLRWGLIIRLRRRVHRGRGWVIIRRRIIVRGRGNRPQPEAKCQARPPPTISAVTSVSVAIPTSVPVSASVSVTTSMEAATASVEAAAAMSCGARRRNRYRTQAGGKAQSDDRTGHCGSPHAIILPSAIACEATRAIAKLCCIAVIQNLPRFVIYDPRSQAPRMPLPAIPQTPAEPTNPSSPYDTRVLLDRARQWRAEAARTTLGTMRAYCLAEADWCERRITLSRTTPVFRGCHD
jgi:hypothetical protein